MLYRLCVEITSPLGIMLLKTLLLPELLRGSMEKAEPSGSPAMCAVVGLERQAVVFQVIYQGARSRTAA